MGDSGAEGEKKINSLFIPIHLTLKYDHMCHMPTYHEREQDTELYRIQLSKALQKHNKNWAAHNHIIRNEDQRIRENDSVRLLS